MRSHKLRGWTNPLCRTIVVLTALRIPKQLLQLTILPYIPEEKILTVVNCCLFPRLLDPEELQVLAAHVTADPIFLGTTSSTFL